MALDLITGFLAHRFLSFSFTSFWF